MDLRKLKTLIDLVAESGIAELEVTEGDSKVRIAKNTSVQGFWRDIFLEERRHMEHFKDP